MKLFSKIRLGLVALLLSFAVFSCTQTDPVPNLESGTWYLDDYSVDQAMANSFPQQPDLASYRQVYGCLDAGMTIRNGVMTRFDGCNPPTRSASDLSDAYYNKNIRWEAYIPGSGESQVTYTIEDAGDKITVRRQNPSAGLYFTITYSLRFSSDGRVMFWSHAAGGGSKTVRWRKENSVAEIDTSSVFADFWEQVSILMRKIENLVSRFYDLSDKERRTLTLVARTEFAATSDKRPTLVPSNCVVRWVDESYCAYTQAGIFVTFVDEDIVYQKLHQHKLLQIYN